jgi:uncharacterized cupin superfamily protein
MGEAAMAKVVVIVDPLAMELEPEPIRPEFILSGSPVARSKKVVTSHDWTSSTVVWDCTPGSFHWHYGKEETIYVLEGEAFMMQKSGEERRFAAGEVGFFYAGFSCDWRITKHFRKVAVVRTPFWTPVGFCVKALEKLMVMVGISKRSTSVFLLAAGLASVLH